MAKRFSRLVTAGVAASLVLALPAAAAGAAHQQPLARNIILLIDDGAGYNTHEVGSLYDTGLRQGEAYNAFPFRFAVTTYGYGVADPNACGDLTGYDPTRAWTEWDYVTLRPTDSAAAATAMSTGTKTRNKALGVDCDGQGLRHLAEAVEATGMSTGVVTSVEFSHATPAGFVVHNPDRSKYQAIAAEMINSSATDVIMGAGHPWYNRFSRHIPATAAAGYTYISKADYDALVAGTAGGDADGDGVADPWTLIETKAAFQALTDGPTPDRVFGLAQVRTTLQQERLPAGTVDPPAYSIPLNANVPSLAEMARGALNVLDANETGFFLVVEGGATDWAADAGQTGLLIEEEITFDRTVDAVLAWVDQHSNWGETLVVVVADHETSYVTGPGSGPTADPMWTPVTDNGIGVAPGFQYNLSSHTNSLVPVYAKGDAGRLLRGMVDGTDPVHGLYVDNTDLHALLLAAAGAQ